MHDTDPTRQRVSQSYAKAVTSQMDGCCGEAGCSGEASEKNVTLAGYAVADLSLVPDDAINNSMGCGDPVALTNVQRGDVVVDLGSGAGIYILLAAQKVGDLGQVIGIDMTDEMLERARVNIAASGLGNVEVRKGIIEDMPIDSDSVDWVISNCVINLSPEKERVFAEIARILKPGGRMVVSDIVAEDLPDEILSDEGMYDSCISGAISESAYIAGLEQAGLESVSVESRITYDEEQMTALLEVDGETTGCCNPTSPADAASAIAGKVWSARFTATKRS